MATELNSQQTASDGGTTEVRQRALREELRELVDVVGPAPLVDLLLERAFQLNATDLHLDPTANGLRVRLRVDGVLHEVLMLPATFTAPVLSRLKLMAGMDITERRMAQDGHISRSVLKHHRDVRVGSGPTVLGERLVLRLMPDDGTLTSIEELGIDDDQLDLVRKAIEVPYGVVLAVGPVGSGKSTTVYSCLTRRNRASDSVVTIEDPVERQMEGAVQIQIDTKIGFTFVRALRGVLRQDPDVMMIGEIRDSESAHIAVRAGLTGVAVFSTLHASDSLAAIDVFREFEVPPMFLVDGLKCVIAQRLVRKVCEFCRTEIEPDDLAKQVLGLSDDEAKSLKLAHGKGCERCFNTGYSGRVGVFEVLVFSPELRAALLCPNTRGNLREIALRSGLVTLEQACKKKVLKGQTTVEELLRLASAFSM